MIHKSEPLDPIVEFKLKNGSSYAIDFTLICCVGSKAWKAIDSDTQDVCVIWTIGGKELYISGLHYERVLKAWRQIRGLSSSASS